MLAAWLSLMGMMPKRGNSISTRAKTKTILTSLDPNIRPALVSDRHAYVKRLRQMMKNADIVKLSDEDLVWLYPGRPLEQALAECRADCNAALFILTLGADGSRGFVEAGEVHVPAAQTHYITDTVGAGDTFMASILARSLRQDEMICKVSAQPIPDRWRHHWAGQPEQLR